MKKRTLAVLSAVMVLAMGSMTVFASASPTAATAEAPVSTQKTSTSVTTAAPSEYASATAVSAGYEAAEVSQEVADSAAVAVQNTLLNDIASIGSTLNNRALTEAASDPSKKVTASILSVVEINPTSAEKDDDGNYVVKMKVKGIASGDAIAVLHYNGSEWEVIVPTKVGAGTVTFSTPSLSPISIVKLEVEDVTASPETGETMPAVMLIAMLGIAGAAFCGKKYFA